MHGLIAGKGDPLGQDRILERDEGKALAAQVREIVLDFYATDDPLQPTM